MWFRGFLAVCSAVFGLLFGWLATHVSFHPQVLGRYSFPYFASLVGVGAVSFASVLVQISFLYNRVHRVRLRILGSVAAVILALVAGEIAVRSLDPLGISHVQESSKLWSSYVADPVLVYRLPSGARGRYQGVTISTNQLGLRERDLEQKRDGELRILLLGDSITFGWGVAAEETFGRRLESILLSRLGRMVRTVNAGVGGFNTVQEYALLENNVDAIDPDLVVLVYVHNDIDYTQRSFDPDSQTSLHGTTPPKMARILLEKSWLYRLAQFALSDADPRRLAWFDKDAPSVRDSMNALAGIARLCRERDIRFETFFYREKQESGREDSYMDQLLAEVSNVGYTNGFRVSDTRAWWRDTDRRSVTLSAVDWHPNARGHDILAQGMAGVLMTQDVMTKRGAATRTPRAGRSSVSFRPDSVTSSGPYQR
jgi:lysophospholipase L1-like esterase